MKGLLVLAALCGTAAFAAPAFAAPDTDAAVAECVVDNAPRDVAKLLETVAGSAAEAAASKTVIDYWGGCNDNATVTGAFAWRERAALAYAALSVRLEKRKPDAAVVASGAATILQASGVAGTDYNAEAAELRRIGTCVLRAAPQASIDFVAATPGSAQESAAVNLLAPALNGCVPTGQVVRLSRDRVRLILAEPLYLAISR